MLRASSGDRSGYARLTMNKQIFYIDVNNINNNLFEQSIQLIITERKMLKSFPSLFVCINNAQIYCPMLMSVGELASGMKSQG